MARHEAADRGAYLLQAHFLHVREVVKRLIVHHPIDKSFPEEAMPMHCRGAEYEGRIGPRKDPNLVATPRSDGQSPNRRQPLVRKTTLTGMEYSDRLRNSPGSGFDPVKKSHRRR